MENNKNSPQNFQQKPQKESIIILTFKVFIRIQLSQNTMITIMNLNFQIKIVMNQLIMELRQNKRNGQKDKILQMKLCNEHPPLIKVNQVHYHKMRSLLEKIKDQKFKWSDEMKIFVEELQKFIQNDPKAEELKPKKKIKKYNDQKESQHDDEESIQRSKTLQDEVKVEDNSAQDFLDQFKMKIKQIEPGIVMFLPEYQKMDPQYRQYYKNLENNYFKDLYYKVRTQEIELNPQNILRLLRLAFQNVNYMIPYKEEHEATQK
ncbi:unnamed protein product [Paramecium sonneborni]|uniref:Uncharacterized protein n=1 Tax=Paramecium sonneborni TaxID=65129 RepID=A0A8S1NZW5_9CILI|nr:unnamed protein product [Paramecium sonneborni]